MPANRSHPLAVALCILYAMLLAAAPGCAGAAPTGSGTRHDHPQVIALIGGRAITADAIDQDLYERAGPAALTEFVLDRELEIEARARGIEISADDIASEQQHLAESFDDLGEGVPTARVLARLRARLGLGPVRYERLLRRNAILRALVEDQSAPTDAEIKLAAAIAFGPRYTIRLFVSNDAGYAADLRTRANRAHDDARPWVFADACWARSTHPSAPRGGLITDFSADDPGYPAAIGQAVRTTPIGSCTGVISTDAGQTLVLVQAKSPPIEPEQAQLSHVRDQLTLRKQRLAMERKAGELVGRAQVIVMDRSLNWAWSGAR